MTQQREVTKRIKNRLMLCVAMFILCGMGLLILLDSWHLGNDISRDRNTPGFQLINLNVPFSREDAMVPACIVYSSYRFAQVARSAPIPTPDQLVRPGIYAYYQSDLTLIYNKTLDFGDTSYYDFRFAMPIPDVDNDTVQDIFANIAKIGDTFTLGTGGEEEAYLIPSYVAYYNVLISGINGSLINGTTPQQASFSEQPMTNAVWVDSNFSLGNELVQRDDLPDIVCMYNISDDSYLEASHLDLRTSSENLAWDLNCSQIPFLSGSGDMIQDLQFVNASQPNNTMVLARSWNNLLRVFVCNGSFAAYPDQYIVMDCARYDFTGDGVEEIYLGSSLSNQLNLSVYNLLENSSVESTEVPLNSSAGGFERCVFITRPNIGNSSGYPDAYFVVHYGNAESTLGYFAWHILLRPGEIELHPLFLGDCERINRLDLVLFDEDTTYDLGVQRTNRGRTQAFVVYDGSTTSGGTEEPEIIESQSLSTEYSSGECYLIPDIGGNGCPDLLAIKPDRLVVTSFETIFFWQHTPLLTVLFFLCIGGFVIGLEILVQWRRALRKATKQGLPEKFEDGTETPQLDAQGKNVKVKRSPLSKALIGFIIAVISCTAPLLIILRFQSIGQPILSANVRLIHLLTVVMAIFYSMIPMVAVLYNVAAPRFATSIYIKAQAKFFSLQPGKHDYRVLVLDFGTRNKRSVASYLSRCLFPIALAMTLGINLYQQITGGSRITDFSGTTVMMDWIASFELYCTLPIILAFGLASFLVPSSWLLDDAGVVFFVENLEFREPGDISRISEWFLKYIKAIAGFTAIYAFIQLFINTDFIIHIGGEGASPLLDIIMTINVFAVLVGLPFLGGFLYMLVAQITVENNLPALKQKLFQRMNAMEIDTTPRQLRNVLDPNDRSPRELEKVWKKTKSGRKDGQSAKSGEIPPSLPQ